MRSAAPVHVLETASAGGGTGADPGHRLGHTTITSKWGWVSPRISWNSDS